GLIALFLFILLGIGMFMFVKHYRNNLNEKSKKKVKKIIIITAIVFTIILTALSIRSVLRYQYIESQPADMIVSTQKSGMIMIDNYEYHKVNTTYGTKKSITESEFNELMSLYGQSEDYEKTKQKIISTNDRYNERNITKVFPFKDHIYYIFVDEDREVYRFKYNIKTNETEEFFYNYVDKGIKYLEGNVIINEYPDLYKSIEEILSNESQYSSTRYVDNRIIFGILDNSPKKTDFICLYEFIPETKETKLLVKFERTNVRDIAFIKADENN
ncbi:hypothetical protein RBH29_05190, partial [Herbivorax sp. ANBcel31]|uniref:hypothetical protein n=1 Tax=Herbivorax sp. ANBcel31 TaxID=3069754 RepID=UPI0027B7D68B